MVAVNQSTFQRDRHLDRRFDVLLLQLGLLDGNVPTQTGQLVVVFAADVGQLRGQHPRRQGKTQGFSTAQHLALFGQGNLRLPVAGAVPNLLLDGRGQPSTAVDAGIERSLQAVQQLRCIFAADCVVKRNRLHQRQLGNIPQLVQPFLAQVHTTEGHRLQLQELWHVRQAYLRGIRHVHIPNARQRRGATDHQVGCSAKIQRWDFQVDVVNLHVPERNIQ